MFAGGLVIMRDNRRALRALGDRDWLIKTPSGQRVKARSLRELCRAVAAGKIDLRSRVCEPGSDKWRSLRTALQRATPEMNRRTCLLKTPSGGILEYKSLEDVRNSFVAGRIPINSKVCLPGTNYWWPLKRFLGDLATGT